MRVTHDGTSKSAARPRKCFCFRRGEGQCLPRRLFLVPPSRPTPTLHFSTGCCLLLANVAGVFATLPVCSSFIFLGNNLKMDRILPEAAHAPINAAIDFVYSYGPAAEKTVVLGTCLCSLLVTEPAESPPMGARRTPCRCLWILQTYFALVATSDAASFPS